MRVHSRPVLCTAAHDDNRLDQTRPALASRHVRRRLTLRNGPAARRRERMAIREQALEALLREERRLPPPSQFREQANANDPALYQRASDKPQEFWTEWARQLDWFEPWRKVLKQKPPHADWFIGGKLNAAYNCLDRHLNGWRQNKAPLIWEG